MFRAATLAVAVAVAFDVDVAFALAVVFGVVPLLMVLMKNLLHSPGVRKQ